MNKLPEGWADAPLGEIADVNPRHPKDLEDDLLVSFVPMPAVSETSPTLNVQQERRLGEVRSGYTHFAEGDVLLAKITPCMENGKAAVASKLRNGLGCGTTELHVLRPRDGINAHYLYLFIHQETFRREAAANFTGTAGQLRVPIEFIRSALIPVAPSAEQRRIDEKTQLLLAKLNSSQERLDNVPRILKRFRQAVLAAACEGRLTADWRTEKGVDLRSWRDVTVNDILAEPLANGRSVPDADRGFPVLRLTCLRNGGIDLSERKIGAWSAKEAKRFRVAKGDFLVARGNGSLSLVGRGGLIEVEPDAVAYPDTLIRIRLNSKEVVPRYFATVWAARPMRDQIETTARTTAGIWKISQGDIESFTIALPGVDEQKEIARRVDALLAVADRIEQRYIKARAFVDGLTQSILAQAFRGELVPTEAELARTEGRSYETAEQLLARVRATCLVAHNGAGRRGRPMRASR